MPITTMERCAHGRSGLSQISQNWGYIEPKTCILVIELISIGPIIFPEAVALRPPISSVRVGKVNHKGIFAPNVSMVD